MVSSRPLIALIATLAAAATLVAQDGSPGRGATPAGRVPVAQADREAVLTQYCVTCHNERARTGGLALDVSARTPALEHPAVWESVIRKLRAGAMPPPGMPRPADASGEALVSALAAELDQAPRDPGRPLLRRLNRAEYGNVIRDLLAIDVDVRSLLPADDSAFGFDNNADLQVISPALLERYLAAADRVSALAVGDPSTVPSAESYFTRGDQSQSQHQDGLPLGTVGGLGVRHYFPLDGDYQFQVALLRTNTESIRGLEQPHELEISVDGRRVFLGTVGGDAEAAQTGNVTERSDATDARLRVRVPVKAGSHLVAATWVRKIGEGTNRLRPFLRSNAGTYDSTGRPHVRSLTVAGPFNPTGPGDTASRRRIFVCHPSTSARPASAVEGRPSINSAEYPPASATAPARSRRSSPETDASEGGCARRILTGLARQAYRRPVRVDDIDPLLTFYREGRRKGTFETGIQLALRRLLASPMFVFREEDDPASVAPGTAFRVSDHELASRLSFFLWSSMPDDTLFRLADAGRLHQPEVLEAQVRRMLADPRAEAVTQNFAGQWLHVRNLQNAAPNTDEFPDFDNDLRDALRREVELFFGSIVREDRPVLDLLTADYTFVNERLAKHYGIPYVYGSQFRRVTVPNDARRGLLGKGSILLATSHADRTAPTLRGKWILENLLGTPPPPPPPNVPALEAAPGRAPKTMRERMSSHRENPGCAGCHRAMDPLGFAMENFDAIGGWRTREAGGAIDASGTLSDGTPIDGVVQLRQAILQHQDAFLHTLTEKLMIYALGRGLEAYDMPVVREIVRDARRQDYRFSSLILGITRSVPFTMRRKAAVSS